ncbi:hypothetical protein EYF80_040890 [Liparis tanakae]|uniref:Uncharacterized protein n=1 Tax=Liparis tanakae TaxID=230148 RepID=A0A4Z2G5R1_9TELE|nr:hypothetical protein EYF80_040890 [Liparis tanakae]
MYSNMDECEIEEPSDKVTDGNAHSLTARLHYSTGIGQPSEIPPLVKQIADVDEDRTEHPLLSKRSPQDG